MTNEEIEKLLLENDFTAKEVAILKRDRIEEGHPYPFLLSQLKKRFIGCGIMMLIFLLIGIHEFFFNESANMLAVSVGVLWGLTVAYFIAPMKLAFKGFRFLRQQGYLL